VGRDDCKTTAIIPPPPFPEISSALEFSFTSKNRHPGKGDPLFRIVRKPGPSVLLDLPWTLLERKLV
jgi:hypothetical protein